MTVHCVSVAQGAKSALSVTLPPFDGITYRSNSKGALASGVQASCSVCLNIQRRTAWKGHMAPYLHRGKREGLADPGGTRGPGRTRGGEGDIAEFSLCVASRRAWICRRASRRARTRRHAHWMRITAAPRMPAKSIVTTVSIVSSADVPLPERPQPARICPHRGCPSGCLGRQRRPV